MAIFGGGDKYYSTVSGPELESIVRELGYAPQLATDSTGDPIIRYKIEGLNCQILFYGVKDGRATSLQFSTGFAGKQSMEKMNEWNKKKRFAKAWLDQEGEPFLQFDVDLDGGVRREYLDEILQRWRSLFVGFVQYLRE